MMSVKKISVFLIVVVAVLSSDVLAEENWADVICSYEHGQYPNTGYTNPQAILSPADDRNDLNGIVSLGQWTDDPDQGNNTDPVGIILGFSTSILNGDGDDLKIQGNALTDWYEPGYVEVARETSGPGATADGWADEEWYLLKPSNYDDLPHDPRTSPIDIVFDYANFATGLHPYTDPHWSSNTMTGYADVSLGGDFMDISWAIDLAGDEVALADIAYVRIRTVSDSVAPLFGNFSTDIDYVEFLNGVVQLPARLDGDANNDGAVSAGDYGCVQANFGNAGIGALGDANGDGMVTAGDYACVQANFGNAASSAVSVPEPSMLFLFSICGIRLLGKRKVR